MLRAARAREREALDEAVTETIKRIGVDRGEQHAVFGMFGPYAQEPARLPFSYLPIKFMADATDAL